MDRTRTLVGRRLDTRALDKVRLLRHAQFAKRNNLQKLKNSYTVIKKNLFQ